MRIRELAVVVTVATLVSAVGACSTGDPNGEPSDAAVLPFDDTVVAAVDDITIAHALEAFPSATPQDWVSYADQVSLFTVLAERQLPLGEHEKRFGEGMVGREVTIKVDRLLWESDTAPRTPGQFAAKAMGWALKDGDLSPMGLMGGPRLEVGEHYLGAWLHSSRVGWGVLSVKAVFPVDGYGRPQRHEWSEPTLTGELFVGASPERVSRMLATVLPIPEVSEYAHLEPLVRRLAVELARMPDRGGFLRAAAEESVGSTRGYVRIEDWERLKREQDPSLAVPFYAPDGHEFTEGEGGGLTLDGWALEKG